MAVSGEDYYCSQFQLNSFDPSRCSSCLRPGHMHLSNITATAQQDDGDDEALSDVNTNATSDTISVGWTSVWSLQAHSLNPDWELNICDSDTQSSSPNQSDSPERSVSLKPQRHWRDQSDMTRLDLSPHRVGNSPWMDDQRSRDRSRRASESRTDREQESGYFSPSRRGHGEKQMEEVNNKRVFRHYERGRPLPSNHRLEPKACVPFRNINLGIPSQRRSTETFIQETWRSESPQRYTYHSNFRGGTKSQENSPTRHYSTSPDRYRLTGSTLESQRRSSYSRSQTLSHPTCQASFQDYSHTSSRHTSGRSSPSRRRGSIVSRTASPSRISRCHKRAGVSQVQDEELGYTQRGRSRESRCPSQNSGSHSLNSEMLYRNLETISRRCSAAIKPTSFNGSQASSQTRTAVNSSIGTYTHNSCEGSPSRTDHGTYHHTLVREPISRDCRPDTMQTYSKTPHERQDKSSSSPPQGSWHGTPHSLLSPTQTHSSSPSRRGVESELLAHSLKSHAATMEGVHGHDCNNKSSGDRSRSNVRRGLETLLTSEPKKAQVEIEEVGMTMEDYMVLADVPMIHVDSEDEFQGLRRRNQSPSPQRDQKFGTSRYHDEVDVHDSRIQTDKRGRGRERGRDRREKCLGSEDDDRPSQRPSTSSHHMQKAQIEGLKQSECPQIFKIKRESSPRTHSTTAYTYRCGGSGWMSKLDEDGKWRKRWFVLGDASLKYYSHSEAEESDDVDGEIDLASCFTVSDCDTEKNYGFQIHTKSAVFILSAVTSRVRRIWVKLLKQTIQTNTGQSDGGEKENPLSQRPSSCQPPAQLTCKDLNYETTLTAADSTTTAANSHRIEHHQGNLIDVDVEETPSEFSPASQREAGEGWDREQAKRLEERNKWFEEGLSFSEMGSRWESMELKKGRVPVPVTETMDSEVNRKWTQFERMCFREMSVQSLIGAETCDLNSQGDLQSLISSQTCQSSFKDTSPNVTGCRTNNQSSKEGLLSVTGVQTIQSNTAQALQREALSLKQQVESIKRERLAMGMNVDCPCGPGTSCRARLDAMEAAHRKSLQELQEKHVQEIGELQSEKDRLLKEESQAAADAIEALRATHHKEMKSEVEKARRLAGGGAHSDATYREHMPPAEPLCSELDVLSARLSQKCLDVSRSEQQMKGRETEHGRMEREMEQLRRENKDLKSKLAEEISRMRYFITGQRSEIKSLGNTSRSPSELEMLLRVKENEVEYLKKENGCLQSEVESLKKEKAAAYERYQEAYVELNAWKGRSQLEIGSLKEHLKLANAALQEGAGHT